MGIMKDQLGVEDFDMTGYSILLKTIEIPEKTLGGIITTETYRNMERQEYEIGTVVAMGVEAFTDRARFPMGPRCKVGDWVVFARYEQQKIKVYDHHCYFLSDDRILTRIPESFLVAVVPHLRNNSQQSAQKGN